MKQIKLTKQQIKNLTEMSKKMFPEYDLVLFDEIIGKIFLYPNLAKTPKLEDIGMHWFEFCIIHLVNAINYPKDKVNNSALIDLNVIGYNYAIVHPVDFLYKEFKKLKLK